MSSFKLDGAPVTLSRTFSFEAAHRLPEHPGKCKNLHGHTYTFEVRVLGPIQPETGMLVDFGQLKQVGDKIVVELDHTCLNDHPELERPTAEVLAYYIARRILSSDFLSPSCSVSVRVSEGLNSHATTPFLNRKSRTTLLTEAPRSREHYSWPR